MSDRLTLKSENVTWYPTSMSSLEGHLVVLLKDNDFFTGDEIYPIKKNIAYSLQFIQFVNQIINDISLSSVLLTQNIKSFVVHGAAVIEAIFNFIVVSSGYGSTTQWRKANKHSSQEYALSGVKYKNEIEVLEKTSQPISVQMTFDQLAKKVESKKLLGDSFPAYSKIKPIRQLRNKIHIHDSDHSLDTDWNNFGRSQFSLISDVLHKVLTSEIFSGSNYFNQFDYLTTASYTVNSTSSTIIDLGVAECQILPSTQLENLK